MVFVENERVMNADGEMIMTGQILVPFNSHLRVKDIISVIEEAAKPGMRVVFLVRYPVDPWEWFRDHWVTTASARDAMLAGRKVIERYSWEGQKALAEEMVAPWRHVLQKMGVKATVDVYTGSLSSVVENYSRGDGISLVNAGSSATSAHREFSLGCQLWTYATSRLNA